MNIFSIKLKEELTMIIISKKECLILQMYKGYKFE